MTSNPDMFRAMIASAFDAGSTVAIYLRGAPDQRFQGSVQDVSAEAFALYHSGDGCGWHWAFCFTDVVAVGLLTPLPADLLTPGCAHHRP